MTKHWKRHWPLHSFTHYPASFWEETRTRPWPVRFLSSGKNSTYQGWTPENRTFHCGLPLSINTWCHIDFMGFTTVYPLKTVTNSWKIHGSLRLSFIGAETWIERSISVQTLRELGKSATRKGVSAAVFRRPGNSCRFVASRVDRISGLKSVKIVVQTFSAYPIHHKENHPPVNWPTQPTLYYPLVIKRGNWNSTRNGGFNRKTTCK